MPLHKRLQERNLTPTREKTMWAFKPASAESLGLLKGHCLHQRLILVALPLACKEQSLAVCWVCCNYILMFTCLSLLMLSPWSPCGGLDVHAVELMPPNCREPPLALIKSGRGLLLAASDIGLQSLPVEQPRRPRYALNSYINLLFCLRNDWQCSQICRVKWYDIVSFYDVH